MKNLYFQMALWCLIAYRTIARQVAAVRTTEQPPSRARRTAHRTETVRPSTWRQALVLLVSLSLTLAPVRAQVIADPKAAAAQRPVVLRDASGNTMVNIQTPSSAGVSRNVYSKFDLQADGVAFNNVRGSNPYILTPAKIILNEVNSSAASILKGAISVKGATADVVIANPSGIQVNGASFTNAGRAILTTGSPVLEAGKLTGIHVRQGQIAIGSAGLRATGSPELEIYARKVTVEGPITANSVSVVTGTQHLDLPSGRLTSIAAGADTKPSTAIDTALLGGMYANRITLLATEEGTGVRNIGTLDANGTNGQLVITADGLLENQGPVKGAVVSLATVQGDIANNSSLQASKFLTMSSGRDVKFSGGGAAQGQGIDIVVSADRNIEFLSKARLTSFKQGGRINLTAGDSILLGNGSVGATGEVQLAADGRVTMSGAALSSDESIVALAGNGLISNSSTITAARVHLETGAAFSNSTADMRVDAGSIAGQKQTTLISSGNLVINNSGNAGVGGRGNVHLQASKDLTVAAGAAITSGADLTLMAGGVLKLSATEGTTSANGQVVRLTSGGDAQLTGGNTLLTGSVLNAAGALSIEALKGNAELNALANAKGSAFDLVRLTAGKDLTVSAYSGSVKAAGLSGTGLNVHLVSSGSTSIDRVEAKTATKTTSVGSSLIAREDLTIGSISADGQVLARGSDLKAAGAVRVSGNGNVYLGAGTNETKAADGTVTIVPISTNVEGSRIAIQGGSVQSDALRVQAKAGDIQIVASKGTAALSSHTGVGANLTASGSIAVHGQGGLIQLATVANAGASYSGTSATGAINTLNAVIAAKDVVSFAAKGGLSHTGGSQVGGAISEYSETGPLNLSDAHLRATSTAGKESAALSGKLSVESGGALVVDAKTTFDARTDLSLVRGTGDMVLAPAGLTRGTVSADQLKFGRDLTLATRDGSLNLVGATGSNGVGSSAQLALTTTGSLNLFGNSVKLQGSRINAGGTVAITATKGDLTVDANLVTNVSGLGAANTQWDSASIQGGQVNLQAAGSIELNAIKIASPGAVSILSGGSTVVAGEHATVSTVTPIDNGDFTREDHLLVRSSITGNKGVSIGALGGGLVLNATDVSAPSGAVKLQALGDITLEAAQNHRMSNRFTSVKKCTWYGSCKKTITNIHDESLVADPVTLTGQSVEMKAGNSIKTYASRLKASSNIRVEAGDEALYYAVWDQTDYSVSVTKKLSQFGIKFNGSNTTNSRSTLDGQVTQLQSKGNILSLSGGDTLLQGTVAEYGGTATFQVGVGEKARADARIILEGVKNRTTQTRTQESNYVVWQKLVNQGSVTETLRMPTFKGLSNPVFIGPVLAQLPAGDFKSQIQTLAKQPGMSYLNDLAARKDVKWQDVKLAFDSWNYKQEGLTPAGAALISVAVAWATNGLGASLLGFGSGTTASFAANAAFTSLANQASITLINNKGNIAKTLKDLASSTTVKDTLSAALTAGVMEQIGALPALKSLKTGSEFTNKLTLNLIDASSRALINTGVNGGDLQTALKAAILSAVVDTAHASAASEIKSLEADYLAHKIAHAVAGCAAGAAGGTSCRDSAIGAAVGEIVAGLMPPENGLVHSDSERAKVLALSKIAAGGISAYMGGNADVAISSADTAVKNNALIPILIGLAWLADKAWTAYQVAQDVADIRDGKKTIEQVAVEKGEGYVVGIVLGNVARYGIKGVKVAGKWIQSHTSHQLEVKTLFNKSGATSSGKIIGSIEKLTPDEAKFVREMQSKGHTVEIIETATGRTPDFLINGMPCELKTISSVADMTVDGLSNAVKRRIMDARGQSANIIIDARNQPGMTLDIAEAGARRAIGADMNQGTKIENLVVLTQDGPVIVTKSP